MRSSAFVLLLVASTAAAQPRPRPGSADAVRQAQAHYKQGDAFAKQALWEDAIRELRAAYDLSALPELLFNIAQAERQKGDADTALATYLKYVELQPDGKAADEARTHIAYLTRERETREAEAKRKADEEAKRKADEDAHRIAEAAATVERQRKAEEDARRAEEDRKRKAEEDARRAEDDRRRAERDRKLAAEAAERDAWNRERAKRTHRRHQGYVIGGIGAGCVAIAGIFGYLGSAENASIVNGGYHTASEISDAISTGKIYNALGYGFGAAGVIGVAIGAPLAGFNWDRGEVKLSATGTGVALSGAW